MRASPHHMDGSDGMDRTAASMPVLGGDEVLRACREVARSAHLTHDSRVRISQMVESMRQLCVAAGHFAEHLRRSRPSLVRSRGAEWWRIMAFQAEVERALERAEALVSQLAEKRGHAGERLAEVASCYAEARTAWAALQAVS